MACLENMYATSALFHSKTSRNNNIGKSKTWMGKIAVVVLAFSSYPPLDSAPFVSTPNPPFSAHSLFLTFLSEIAPLPTSIFFLSSPSGLVRLVSQHSFSWFHPNAQPLGCGAPPLLLFQLICYPLASFSHPWPPSLFL